jgi:hypothetical protein
MFNTTDAYFYINKKFSLAYGLADENKLKPEKITFDKVSSLLVPTVSNKVNITDTYFYINKNLSLAPGLANKNKP